MHQLIRLRRSNEDPLSGFHPTQNKSYSISVQTPRFGQLFSRTVDTQFASFDALYTFCLDQQENSKVHCKNAADILPMSYGGELGLKLAGDRSYGLNDWSFSQVCRMSGVRKETINHLKVETAAQVLFETFPTSQRPFQVLTHQGHVRSIQAESFSGPSNASLLEVIIDEAYDYAPPLTALGGVSGLYAGQQDMFAFLIDNKAVIEIDGERFTPGFVLWNSEVGRRRFGIHAYWHQHSCSNHIIWDPNAAMGFPCKRRVSVAGAIEQFRHALRHLIASQSVRRDRFAESVKAASKTSLGPSSSDVFKVLTAQGIGRAYVREAIDVMDRNNSLSIFNAIDYLTQVTRQIVNAGDRVDQEMKVGSLLSLAC